jgi:type IV pilus assembly protein PilC
LSNIRKQGLFPTKVELTGAAKKKAQRAAASSAKGKGALSMELKMPAFLTRVKAKQLMMFTRQLSTLINAGLPLLRCLQVLQRQERNPAMKKAINQMSESIQSGSTFAEALAQHGRIFNRLYVNMAKAGEVGGILDQVLERLAEFMEKAQAIKSKVISAMIYPIVVLLMAVGIVGFLMVYILPKFKDIFAELLQGQQLPPLTQFVMNFSTIITQKLPILIGVIVGVVLLVKLVGVTAWGRYTVDHFKLVVPVFGPLVRRTAIARFSRTLGTLMTSGVPVLQALNIVRDTAGNEVIARAVNKVHDAVKEGENMAPPIEDSKVFPPMVISMVEVGEETGDLPEMLMKVADSYDDEVDNAVAGLTSIIEPILIIFLALVVGTIVIALFLPMISIIGRMS